MDGMDTHGIVFESRYPVSILACVSDTTIKVDSLVRDRLAVLAAERNTTIRALVEQIAADIPTRAEVAQRQADAVAYIREHFIPDFNNDDIAAGEQLWRSLETDAHARTSRGGTGGQAA